MNDDPQLANCKKRNEGVRKHKQVNTINYKESVKTVEFYNLLTAVPSVLKSVSELS